MTNAAAFETTRERDTSARSDGDRLTTGAIRTAERAQPTGTLQRTVGNAQLCRILRMAEPGSATTAEPGPAGALNLLGGGQPVNHVGNSQIKRKQCHCDGLSDAVDMCAECTGERSALQRYAIQASRPIHLPPSVTQAIQGGGGERLPAANRAPMERTLGVDLSGVRIHKDSDAAHAAQDINAGAFTVGQDVYFGAGRYEPGTKRGDHLLAHELTHTVQQAAAGASLLADTPMSSPADPLEREAEAVAGGISNLTRSTASPQVSAMAQPGLQRYSFGEFLDDAESAATSVYETAGSAAHAAGRVAEEALDTATEIGGQVAADVKSIAGDVADTVTSFAGTVARGAQSLYEDARAAAEEAWNRATGIARDAWELGPLSW